MTSRLQTFYPLLLPLILGGLLSLVFFSSRHASSLPPALTPSVPLNDELDGWYGAKQQESNQERLILAKDTQFRKACYFDYSLGSRANKMPCSLSVVISGKNMNGSIHRPEACLPTQGHFNLKNSTTDFTLENGKSITMMRLSSDLNISPDPTTPEIIHCIHYYIFIGADKMTPIHLERTFYDIKNRIIKGETEGWAYIQVGANYSKIFGTTEQDAERQLHKLIKQLIPQLIEWDRIKE